MALKPLHPAVTAKLGNGWELVASEGGRSSRGLRTTVTLCNGEAQACRTLAMGEAREQQALIVAFAGIAEQDAREVAKALARLSEAVEGVLRQMETQHAGESHPSQATRLITLAIEANVELFHTPQGEAYATLQVEDHKETWLLKVKGFRRWLARLFYAQEENTPSAQAVHDALGVLEGKALYDGPECCVYTRLAEHQEALYLDLTDAQWRVVEITAQGWRVISDPPVKFRRARGMLSLPVPISGGSLADLRPFVNLVSDDDWRLLVSWLVATLRPTGPYPILVVHGEHGSAKSTLVRVLRSLVDPNTAALRTTPRDERDLVIAATNSWLVALDNLSHISDWLSDACCRLATGSGFATRELYTDNEETLFTAQRPIVLNAIEELATRGDLLDRAILLSLPTIAEDRRLDEKTFWRAFENVRPMLLGALLDVVSQGLQTLPSVRLDRLPRMADFALWACAVAPACGWTAQAFVDAYTGVREAAYDLTLEASPVAPYLRKLVDTRGQWGGTAGELLVALEGLAGGKRDLSHEQGNVGSDVTKHKAWPKNGRALSNALRRLAPTLRAVGIAITLGTRVGKSRDRLITLAGHQ